MERGEACLRPKQEERRADGLASLPWLPCRRIPHFWLWVRGRGAMHAVHVVQQCWVRVPPENCAWGRWTGTGFEQVHMQSLVQLHLVGRGNQAVAALAQPQLSRRPSDSSDSSYQTPKLKQRQKPRPGSGARSMCTWIWSRGIGPPTRVSAAGGTRWQLGAARVRSQGSEQRPSTRVLGRTHRRHGAPGARLRCERRGSAPWGTGPLSPRAGRAVGAQPS